MSDHSARCYPLTTAAQSACFASSVMRVARFNGPLRCMHDAAEQTYELAFWQAANEWHELGAEDRAWWLDRHGEDGLGEMLRSALMTGECIARGIGGDR